MDVYSDIYSYNEKQSNHYFASCLRYASLYIGLVSGVWNSSIMRSVEYPGSIAKRLDFVISAIESGDDLLWRSFCFYNTLIFIHLISIALSGRTHGMLEKQDSMTREGERIRVELDVAKEIQNSMQTCIFPAFPKRNDFAIFAGMVAARDVGGDSYVFFMDDDSHPALVVGDVSGKGVSASLFMAITKTLIKDHVRLQKDVSSVFNDVNAILCESNREDFFITAFLAVIDIETGLLSVSRLRSALPLSAMEGTRYKSEEMKLAKNDVMFLYMDGVTEAEVVQGRFYTEKRLQDVLDFRGEAESFDDLTMLAMEYSGTKCKKDGREEI